MKIQTTGISESYIIEPDVFPDDRGLFFESYNKKKYGEIAENEFVQDNVSVSGKNVIRGLHYQKPFTQGKLVMALFGEIFDVLVDLRKDSKSFGKWLGFYLSSENKKQIYIPPGCAHGFAVTSDTAIVLYKCTDYYCQKNEHTLKWNDPNIGIDWPVKNPILSDKDKNAPFFKTH